MLFLCYSKCIKCRKAEKWLNDKGFKYKIRDIKSNNPTKDELKEWHNKSGLPLKKLFNTSGLKYKELGLSKKLVNLSEDEQLDLLSSDGLLVKRPVLITENFVIFGFNIDEWSKELNICL